MDDSVVVWARPKAAKEAEEYAWVRGVAAGDAVTMDDGRVELLSAMEADMDVCRGNAVSDMDDLGGLPHLNEPSMVHCLEERFAADKVYCHTGEMLLAVNPFKVIPRLYDVDVYEEMSRAGSRRPPHVFTTAHETYTALHAMHPSTGSHQNQTVLVSGESGSGKTESTKFIMQYLAVVSKSSDASGDIAEQVLQSNPILESFGNARTLRNDNSSRFGKFVKIWFAPEKHSQLRLIGTTIETYLLEKVRLVHQAPGERNFHIFYELLAAAAANPQLRDSLHLHAPVTAYAYLKDSGCFERRDHVRDGDVFQATMRAMSIVGFRDDEKASILEVVAALLHLGNMAFGLQPGGSSGGSDATMSDVASVQELRWVAALLAVDPARLRSALTKRQIKAKDEWYVVQLTLAQAEEARDAMARSVYGYLFDWIVAKVNTCIGGDAVARSDRFIGVLDIFGFESFDVNSFEQLCINYANERLQHHFIDFVLTQEQKRYTAEGIPWETLAVPHNDGCLDILEARPTGLLALLDEECNVPKGSDAGLCRKLYQIYAAHGHFAASRRDQVELAFVVRHYAGAVRYEARGFCDKNRDKPHQELFDLLSSSTNAFVALLCRPVDVLAESLAALPVMQRRKSSLVSLGLGSQFRRQLHQLLEMIAGTQPHYVRCLKPNDANRRGLFQRQRMADQLRYGGVLAAVRIARQGYAVHMPHATFVARYRLLAHGAHVDTVLAALAASALAEAWPRRPEATAWAALGLAKGKTLVFLRQATHEYLEAAVGAKLTEAAVRVQAFARMAYARGRLWRGLAALRLLQRVMRGFLARCEASRRRRRRRAVVIVQAQIRGYLRRQAWHRWKRRRACEMIQRQWRRHVAQTALARARQSAVRIQCRWRCTWARRELRARRADALSLQHAVHERNELRQRLLATRHEADAAKQRADAAERELQRMHALVRSLQQNAPTAAPTAAPPLMPLMPVRAMSEEAAPLRPELGPSDLPARAAFQLAPSEATMAPSEEPAPAGATSDRQPWLEFTALAAPPLAQPKTTDVLETMPAAAVQAAPSPMKAPIPSDVAMPPVETAAHTIEASGAPSEVPSTTSDVIQSPQAPELPPKAPMAEVPVAVTAVAAEFVASCLSHAAPARRPLAAVVQSLLSRPLPAEVVPPPADVAVAVTAPSAAPLGLLERNATYLTWASLSLDALRDRLRRGASPNEQDPAGRSLLHFAVETGNAEMVDLLLQYGADAMLPDFAAQETPVHIAAKLANMEIAGIFCRPDVYPGLDLNMPDKEGNTVLHLAAMSPRPLAAYVLELFLCFGADANAANVLGRTPVHVCALHRRDAALVERLLAFGADPNVYAIDRKTPLHVAAKRGSTETAAALVRGGASLTLPDGTGWRVESAEMALELRRHIRHPPVLVPDADAPTCMLCAYPFNFLVRRHHCRRCGIVGCSDCVVDKCCVACSQAIEGLS
ncbi:myosin-like protein [Achlya hypogyna]|uniref:Myosin-like protein n=1 Tax=Achlya hypogyna TaxID=1202772 RepID=A0A1V9ZJ43_ACHHY|nr:myosin-like protein [Achlya hypogyna]